MCLNNSAIVFYVYDYVTGNDCTICRQTSNHEAGLAPRDVT